jgi:hypothetical protein
MALAAGRASSGELDLKDVDHEALYLSGTDASDVGRIVNTDASLWQRCRFPWWGSCGEMMEPQCKPWLGLSWVSLTTSNCVINAPLGLSAS